MIGDAHVLVRRRITGRPANPRETDHAKQSQFAETPVQGWEMLSCGETGPVFKTNPISRRRRRAKQSQFERVSGLTWQLPSRTGQPRETKPIDEKETDANCFVSKGLRKMW